MPFFAVMPATMMTPMNDEILSVIPVSSSAAKLPTRQASAAITVASAGASRPNSHTTISSTITSPVDITSAS